MKSALITTHHHQQQMSQQKIQLQHYHSDYITTFTQSILTIKSKKIRIGIKSKVAYNAPYLQPRVLQKPCKIGYLGKRIPSLPTVCNFGPKNGKFQGVLEKISEQRHCRLLHLLFPRLAATSSPTWSNHQDASKPESNLQG